MRRRQAFLLLTVGLTLIAEPAVAASNKTISGGDGLTFVSPDMPEMARAEAEARRTLPLFWHWLSQQPPDQAGFMVKVGFPIDKPVKSIEFMWVNRLSRDGQKVMGKLDNDPDFRQDLRAGDKVSFQEGQIVDWAVRFRGREYGHFTTRVMIKGHPKDEAEMSKILSVDPYPPGFK